MIANDLRHAVRSLRKSPGFFAVGTLTLAIALGLGATTYATLDAVRHPYTPIRDVDRVYSIWMWGDGRSGNVTTWDIYTRLRDQGRFFEAISFTSSFAYAAVQAGEQLDNVLVQYAAPSLFELLDVAPIRGRAFNRDPHAVGDDGVALVTAEYWRTTLHGEPLSRATVTVQGETYAVIGVLPPGHWIRGDIWLRAPPSVFETGVGTQGMEAYVRLRRGVTPEMARRKADAIAAALTRDFGTGLRDFRIRLWPMKPPPRELETVHYALAAAALLILLIGCANLANLMLVRGTTRRRELAVRTAVGARRSALVRLLLSEAVLVAIAGAVGGALLAVWGTTLLQHQLPPEIPGIGLLVPRLSWRVFAFGVIATGVTIVLFGLLPALRASNVQVNEPLKDTAGTTTGRRQRDFHYLAIGEVALSLAVLMAGFLLIKAADSVAAYDFGYDPHRLWSATVWLGSGTPEDSLTRFADDALTRVRTTDGVLSAAMMAAIGGYTTFSDQAAGQRLGGRVYRRTYPIVSPGFLRTLGIPIVRGRDFAEGDRHGTGAVILDEAAADSLWPGDSAVGRMIKISSSWGTRVPWRPVVGIARNAVLDFQTDPDLPREPGIYILRGTDGDSLPMPRRWNIVFRTRDEGAVTALRVQHELGATLGTRRGVFVRPWIWSFDDVVTGHEFIAAIFVVFAIFALGLAVVGLYGVLAYAANERQREFGVRVALGARAPDLARLVLHDALVMVLAGTAIGAFFAMWGSRTLGTWLYDVPQTDAVALVTAEGILFVTAMLAALGPALRAMRANPLEILRST